MQSFESLLDGGDLRSLAQSKKIIQLIRSQDEFDQLFKYVFSSERLVAMRAIDVVEKIVAIQPLYIQSHKKDILSMMRGSSFNEMKWHIALILPRIPFNKKEIGEVWQYLTSWSLNKLNSNIVRVNSVQGLFGLLIQEPSLTQDFLLTIHALEHEQIPSLNARIRKLLKALEK